MSFFSFQKLARINQILRFLANSATQLTLLLTSYLCLNIVDLSFCLHGVHAFIKTHDGKKDE
jgi:hypothetical protein